VKKESNSLTNSNIARKIVLTAYVVGMLLLVSLPLNDAGSSFLTDTYVVKIRLDYLAHVILFLPFLFMVKQAYSKRFYLIFLAGLVFAGLCEGMQYLLPYRSFNVNDLMANMIGIVIGVILVVGPIWEWLEREAFRMRR